MDNLTNTDIINSCIDILIHHQGTLQEMTKFIKKESISGYTFQAEAGGHDDITMTVVELSSVFENNLFHDLINRFMGELDPKFRMDIEKRLSLVPKIEGTDYTSLFNAQRNAAMRRTNTAPPQSNNPYMNNNSNLGNMINNNNSSLGGWGLNSGSNNKKGGGLGGYGWGQ